MSKARLQEAEIGEGTIFSHIRHQHWNTLDTFCLSEYKRTSDPLYMFWKAFAQYRLNNINEAVNNLLTIQQKK